MAATAVGLVTAAVGAYSAYSSSQNAKKQMQAQEKASKDAQDAASKESQMQLSKTPSPGSFRVGNSNTPGGSNATTLLTGTSGVDPNKLNIGGTTLLGG